MIKKNKFRGLRMDGQGWVYGGITSLSHTPDGKTYIVSNEGFENDEENEKLVFIEVMPETVGQLHNSLTNKSGQEVYVGDKISYRLAEGLGFPESDDREGIVNTIEDHYGYYKNVKVIGSIHEGKETNS